MIKGLLVFGAVIFSATVSQAAAGQATTLQSCMFLKGITYYSTVTNQMSAAQAKKVTGMACLKHGGRCVFKGCKAYVVPAGTKLPGGTVTKSGTLDIPSEPRSSRARGPSEDEIRRDGIDRRAGNINGGDVYTDITGTTHYSDGTSSRRTAAGVIEFSDGTYANPGEIYKDIAGNVHYGKKICYTDIAGSTSCHNE